MSFSFTGDLTVDVDYVRFHIGDTTESEAFLSDELITSLVSVNGNDKDKAVIAGIRYIITQLSKPNFRADWLQVDYEAARRGYENLLKRKQQELGVNPISASVGHTYRPDKPYADQPDYNDNRPSHDGTYDDYHYPPRW